METPELKTDTSPETQREMTIAAQHNLPRWLLPSLDVLAVFVTFALAFYVRYNLQLIRPVLDPTRSDFGPYLPFALIFAGVIFLNNQGNNLYRHVRGRSLTEEVTAIANGVGNATVILLALFFVFQPTVTSRLMLVYVAIFAILNLSLVRIGWRLFLRYLREQGIGVERVLVVGMGEVGTAVLSVMISRSDLGYKVIGFLDDDPERGQTDLGRVPALGHVDQLEDCLRQHNATMVIITLRWKHYHRIMELARIARQGGAQVRVVPDIFQLNMRQLQVENLDGIPLLGVNGYHQFQGTPRLFKRALDLSLVILAAPLWLAIMALVALALRIEGKGPILYRQRRIGENGKPFEMIKFRTMIPDAEEYQQTLIEQTGQDPRHPKFVDDPRITPVGRFLRRLSLDEFPNLFNVLRGEMSLVGPRPPTPDEVSLYESWHMQRLRIIPGITGLWQVSGRSEVPFDEMCLMDIYYIENWSIKFDVQILMMTLPYVLLRRGAY